MLAPGRPPHTLLLDSLFLLLIWHHIIYVYVCWSTSAQVSLYRWAGRTAAPLARLNFTVEVSELQINDDYLAVICSGAAATERFLYAASNRHPGHPASPE